MEGIIVVVLLEIVATEALYIEQRTMQKFELLARVVRSLVQA